MRRSLGSRLASFAVACALGAACPSLGCERDASRASESAAAELASRIDVSASPEATTSAPDVPVLALDVEAFEALVARFEPSPPTLEGRLARYDLPAYGLSVSVERSGTHVRAVELVFRDAVDSDRAFVVETLLDALTDAWSGLARFLAARPTDPLERRPSYVVDGLALTQTLHGHADGYALSIGVAATERVPVPGTPEEVRAFHFLQRHVEPLRALGRVCEPLVRCARHEGTHLEDIHPRDFDACVASRKPPCERLLEALEALRTEVPEILAARFPNLAYYEAELAYLAAVERLRATHGTKLKLRTRSIGFESYEAWATRNARGGFPQTILETRAEARAEAELRALALESFLRARWRCEGDPCTLAGLDALAARGGLAPEPAEAR